MKHDPRVQYQNRHSPNNPPNLSTNMVMYNTGCMFYLDHQCCERGLTDRKLSLMDSSFSSFVAFFYLSLLFADDFALYLFLSSVYIHQSHSHICVERIIILITCIGAIERLPVLPKITSMIIQKHVKHTLVYKLSSAW